MKKNLQSFLEEFDLVLSINDPDLEIEEEVLPWSSGAVAVKKALDAKHGTRNRASSVIARMGGIKDPQKRKIRDQVLSLYRQEGAALKQMAKDQKRKKKKSSTTSSRGLAQKAADVPDTENSSAKQKKNIVIPKESKPNLRRVLGQKPSPRLTTSEKKTALEIAPQVAEKAESFCQKHPILTRMTGGAILGGVCGVAATAAYVAATGGVGAVVPVMMVAGGQIAAASAAIGTHVGKSMGVQKYLEDNINKPGTFANKHPRLTALGTL